LRRLQIVFAELGDRAIAVAVGAQVARGVGAGERLTADFFLELNEAVEERLSTL
jgi:hypothetical protein